MILKNAAKPKSINVNPPHSRVTGQMPMTKAVENVRIYDPFSQCWHGNTEQQARMALLDFGRGERTLSAASTGGMIRG